MDWKTLFKEKKEGCPFLIFDNKCSGRAKWSAVYGIDHDQCSMEHCPIIYWLVEGKAAGWF